jgi:hypothetical protein
MWTRLLLKPWWVRALAPAGVLALVVVEGLCAHGVAAHPHRSWLVALAERVAVIVIVSLLLAASTTNSHRAYTNAVAGLDSEQRSAAIAASVRGAVPADAPVRDAAIRIARARRVSAVRWRPLLTAGLGLVAFDLVVDPWLIGSKSASWTDLVFILCFAAGAWYVSLSAGRRLQTLSHAVDSDR